MTPEPLFGPGWGNYAIQGIVELTLPEKVSFVPQTPGWWMLLAVVLAAIVATVRRRRQRWLRDGYRRAASAKLAEVRSRLTANDVEALRELAPLLRATALAAGDRASMTRLSGQGWAEAVNAMAPDQQPVPVAELEQLAYGPLSEQSVIGSDRLLDAIDAWIRNHEATGA